MLDLSHHFLGHPKQHRQSQEESTERKEDRRAELEVKGGLSSIHLELPAPSSVVPIRISGGAAAVTIQRPGGVAARVHLKGWISELIFDDQTFSHVGNDVRLQSPGIDPTAPCYDIEVAGSASVVTITSG